MKKTKNPAAQALGKLGGEARKKRMTAKQRSEGARKAALAKWAKWREEKDRLK